MNAPVEKKPPANQSSACGERLTRAARRFPAVKAAAEFLGICRLSEEYAACWHEAESEAERKRLWLEYRREVRRAMAVNLGIHGALGGMIHLVINDPRWIVGVAAAVYVSMRWLLKQ